MSGSLDESTSKFHLNNDWTSSVEEGIKEILLNTWQEWGFEEIDEEFILFVMDMIKNRKTMGEIADELIAVGLDESQTKFITEKFVGYLKSVSPTASKPAVGGEDKSLDRLLAPLKTPRNPNSVPEEKVDSTSASASTNDKRNVSRLLNSALSSARNDTKAKVMKKGKRSMDDMEGNNNTDNNSRKNRSLNNQAEDTTGRKSHKQQKIESHPANFQPPLPPFPPGPMPMGFPPVPPNYGMMPNDPIQYFEHMNEVALKSGFKNAQEMLSAFQGSQAPPQYPPYGGMFPPPPYEQPPFHPPYPGPRHHGGRNSGGRSTHYRAGRGRGGAEGTETAAAPKSESVPPTEKDGSEIIAAEKSQPTQIEELTGENHQLNSQSDNTMQGAPRGPPAGRFPGRGGRFSRGAPSVGRGGGRFGGRAIVPTVPTFNNPFASNNQSLEAAVTNAATFNPPAAGRGRGRAAAAGRSGGNKVWVRPTEATPQNIQS